MGIKELVNAFNLNNYACDKISTNFTVEGKKIVGLFAGDTNIGEYLQRMEKEIIGRHYGTKDIANEYYNLDCFPFVSGANHDEEYLSNGIVKVKLADSTDPAVIHNLKVHFASEFKRVVQGKVAARLQEEAKITKKEAYEWIRGTVGTGAIGMCYLYCIAFGNEYLGKRYFPRIFELFKSFYISEFNSRLEACGLKSSDFYKYEDGMLYIKDVSDKVVKGVTEYVKKEVALYLETSGIEDPKVENFKDVLGDFIFKCTGKSINAYGHDIFTDKKKIENGNDFVLIPLTKRYSGQLESLKHKDVYEINIKYKNLMSDIRGKTAKSDVASYENPVYAISNKRIAQLLPIIMQSPIAYNQITGCFEFAVDLENFKRRGSSRSSSTVNSPIHAGPSGLSTPPNQRSRSRDSGIGESPPKPNDYVAPSTSGGPRSSFGEVQEPQPHVPRQVSHNLGAAEVGAAANMPAWASTSSRCSSQSTSGNELLQLSSVVSRPLSWQGINPVGADPLPKQIRARILPTSNAELRQQSQVSSSEPSSSKGADESMRTGKSTWYLSSSGVEDVNNVEHEKQQVSGECSEAKPQESEPPKKRRGGFSSKISTFFSPSKSKHDASLNRCDVGRDTTRSVPAISVTEKPPVSKRFFSFPSRVRAENNSPSKETSPVTEACTKNKPGATELEDGGFSNKPKIRALTSVYPTKLQESLDPDQREELLKEGEIKKSSVKAQLPGERGSQASADSGLGKSLERGQSPSLIEKFNDKSLINSRVDSPNIKKHLQGEVFV